MRIKETGLSSQERTFVTRSPSDGESGDWPDEITNLEGFDMDRGGLQYSVVPPTSLPNIMNDSMRPIYFILSCNTGGMSRPCQLVSWITARVATQLELISFKKRTSLHITVKHRTLVQFRHKELIQGTPSCPFLALETADASAVSMPIIEYSRHLLPLPLK